MKGKYVTAYRGNQTKQFTLKSWNVMGTDKYGWTLVPEVPKEVAETHKIALSASGENSTLEAHIKDIGIQHPYKGDYHGTRLPLVDISEQGNDPASEIKTPNVRKNKKRK